MTREEAIKEFEFHLARQNLYDDIFSDACRLAIKALQERPKGRWIELPCEIGDTVYLVDFLDQTFDKAIVNGFEINAHGLYINSDYEIGTRADAGYLFFTEEKMEKALADMREEKLTLDSVITGLEEMLNTVDKLIKDIDKTSDMMENFGADMRESE